MGISLALGPIIFSGFEVPDRISFGGRQRLVIHMMPGGGRVVDAMGAEDAPIRWSGIFSGQLAAARIRTLERLRKSGAQTLLSWDAWRFNVVIQEFEAEMTNSFWIPYRLELCVISSFAGVVSDWLDAVISPLATLGIVSPTAIQTAIETASSGLRGGDLGSFVAAARQMATNVTALAYQGKQ